MKVKIGEIAKLLDVSVTCVRKWSDDGRLKFSINAAGTRYYDPDDLYHEGKAKEDVKTGKRDIFYCRVSSNHQKEDLERQIERAKELRPNAEIVKDIASGLNWKRKGLRSVIKRAIEGEVGKIYVFHKDRLCRFGFEILQYIFELHQVQLLVLDSENHKSREQEMSEDVLEIMHVFSCSLYGKRGHKKFQAKNSIQVSNGTSKDVDSGKESEIASEDQSIGTEEDDGTL